MKYKDSEENKEQKSTEIEPMVITIPSGIQWRQPGEPVLSQDHNLCAGQSVMRFASAAERTNQFQSPAPLKNMLSMLGDAVGRIEYFDGTSWRGYPTGRSRLVERVTANKNLPYDALTDYIYLCSNQITVTLPTAVGNVSMYTIKQVGSQSITINTNPTTETIDGDNSVVLTVQFISVSLVSDGSNWNAI